MDLSQDPWIPGVLPKGRRCLRKTVSVERVLVIKGTPAQSEQLVRMETRPLIPLGEPCFNKVISAALTCEHGAADIPAIPAPIIASVQRQLARACFRARPGRQGAGHHCGWVALPSPSDD